MAVYVDALIAWPQKAKSGGKYFGSGKQSCHLMADTEEELHAFAAQLGLKRAWYQPKSSPHYDLTPNKRAQALRFGAIEETTEEFIARRRRQRAEQQAAAARAVLDTIEETV